MSNAKVLPAAGLTVYPAAPDWVQGSTKFIFDEATGTVKVRPELRDKVAKALYREAARIQRRLLVRQFKLQVSYLALDTKRTILLMASYALSFMK